MGRWSKDQVACKNGHTLSPENVVWEQGSHPRRRCKTCRNLKRAKMRASEAYKTRKVRRQRERRADQLPPSYLKIGATQQDFDEFFDAQAGCCAICGKPQELKADGLGRKVGRLHLDHDHQTGEFRGLLCWSCNTKLGWFENNQEAVNMYLGGG